jgi:hypothetical protein
MRILSKNAYSRRRQARHGSCSFPLWVGSAGTWGSAVVTSLRHTHTHSLTPPPPLGRIVVRRMRQDGPDMHDLQRCTQADGEILQYLEGGEGLINSPTARLFTHVNPPDPLWHLRTVPFLLPALQRSLRGARGYRAKTHDMTYAVGISNAFPIASEAMNCRLVSVTRIICLARMTGGLGGNERGGVRPVHSHLTAFETVSLFCCLLTPSRLRDASHCLAGISEAPAPCAEGGLHCCEAMPDGTLTAHGRRVPNPGVYEEATSLRSGVHWAGDHGHFWRMLWPAFPAGRGCSCPAFQRGPCNGRTSTYVPATSSLAS